jgi:hypothetical protein
MTDRLPRPPATSRHPGRSATKIEGEMRPADANCDPTTRPKPSKTIGVRRARLEASVLLCRILAVDSDGAVRALSWALLALSGPSTLVLSLILIAWHPQALPMSLPFLYAFAFALWVLRSPRPELLERNLRDLAALVMACAGRCLPFVRLPIRLGHEAQYKCAPVIESPPWPPPLETYPQVQPNAPSCPLETIQRFDTCSRVTPGGPTWPLFPMNPTANPTTHPRS